MKSFLTLSTVLLSFMTLAQNDPLLFFQKDLISLPKELERDVVVAVIDTGIDYTHPDLKDNLAYNDIECDNGLPQIGVAEDRDHNGYAGDCLGWNFIPNESAADAAPEKIPSSDSSQMPFDEEGHGTHVSGIISVTNNNGIGLSGISNHIKILPLKAFEKSYQARNQFRVRIGTQIQNLTRAGVLIQAIDYAIKRNVDVINFSTVWNKNIDNAKLREKIQEAQNAGIIIVAGAGNDGSETAIYPCLYEGVVCVGASDEKGQLLYNQNIKSNYGAVVDILAPGDQVLSTFPTSSIVSRFIPGYDFYSGTSQATPYISKIFAVLKSLYPEIEVNDLKAKVLLNADKILDQQDTSRKVLRGKVNPSKSLDENFISQYILPSFKTTRQTIINANGEFTFNINLAAKRLSNDVLRATIESLDKKITLDQSITINLNSNEKNYVLTFHGAINDLSVSQKSNFKLTLYDQNNTKEDVFYFSTKFFQDEVKPKAIYPFEFKTEQPYFSIKNQDKGTALRAITDLSGNKTNAFYVEYFFKNENIPSVRLTLHQLTANSIKEVTVVNISDVLKTYGLKPVDLNHDNISEYLFFTETVDNTNQKRYVKIYYLDDKLNPVYKDVPYIRYELLFNLYANELRYPLYPSGNVSINPVVVDGKVLPQILSFYDNAVLKDFQKVTRFIFQSKDGIGSDMFQFTPTLSQGNWTYNVKSFSELVQNKDVLNKLNLTWGEKIIRMDPFCRECSVQKFTVTIGKGKVERMVVLSQDSIFSSDKYIDISHYLKRFLPETDSYLAVRTYNNKKVHILDLKNNKQWWATLPTNADWKVLQIAATKTSPVNYRILLTDGEQLHRVVLYPNGTNSTSTLYFEKYFGTSVSNISDLFEATSSNPQNALSLSGYRLSDLGMSLIPLDGAKMTLEARNAFIIKNNCLSLGLFSFENIDFSSQIQLCQTPSGLQIERY